MGRRRRNALPPGLYQRGKVIWCSFYDQCGERVQERAGATIEEAQRHLRDRERSVAAGTYQRSGGTGERTIETYARAWIEHRRAEGVRSVAREEQMLRDHITPHIGSVRLSELRPRDVAAWIRKLAGSLSPKSIRNVHGVLSAMFARARFDELVSDNPAKGLPRGVLPKNTRSRKVGAWTRAECATLISHSAISDDRRVGYAVAVFTGARCGEVAGLRWRDIDTQATPLWRWALRTQYDGQPLKGHGREGGNPRDIPIHPELRALLELWKADGWARCMRRHPKPDDFVCPRETGAVHSKQSLGSKAIHRHAAVAGLSSEGRDFHSLRRAMITLCRTDGAREEILERITHNASGSMVDQYTYFGWEALCEAVSCLRLRPEVIAPAIPLDARPAVTPAVTSGGIGGKIAAIYMEAPGVEASSQARSPKISGENALPAPLPPPRKIRGSSRIDAPIPVPVTAVPSAVDPASIRAAITTLRAMGQDAAADELEAKLEARQAKGPR